MKINPIGRILSMMAFIAGLLLGLLSNDSFLLSLIAGCLFAMMIILWNLEE